MGTVPEGPERAAPLRAALALLAIAGGLGGMIFTALGAARSIQESTTATVARVVSGYLAVVTRESDGGENYYDPVHLLSGAGALTATSFFQAGLQVSWGTIPILPDSIGLQPLEDSVQAILFQERTGVVIERGGRVIALEPLLNRGQTDMAGWVAVWGLEPRGPGPGFRWLVGMWSALVALCGLSVVVGTGGIRQSPLARWCLLLPALLAAGLGLWLEPIAHAGTATSLRYAGNLVHIAATLARVNEPQLNRISEGRLVRLSEGVGAASERRMTDSAGVVHVVATVPLRGGRGFEVSVVPFEASLGRWWVRLLGWGAVATLGLLLAAGRDRLDAAGQPPIFRVMSEHP